MKRILLAMMVFMKYISLVAELRQIAVRRALALLDEKEEAVDRLLQLIAEDAR